MNGAKRTKLLAVIMLATLAMAGITLSAVDDSNNSDASGLTFTVSNGCLYINGTGAMQDYTQTESLCNLYSFTSCIIGYGITSIGTFAFNNCTSLTSVTIPNSLTYLESYTFYNCASLTSITIPSSVTSIGYQSFYNCASLTSIIFNGSKPTFGNYSMSLRDYGPSVSATIYTSGWGSSSVFTSSIIGSYTTFTYSLLTKNVTFQSNNGDNVTVIVVSPGSTISSWPSDPVKAGYVFTGWYSDAGLTTLFVISTPITADITLYAGYEISLVFQTEPSAVANVTASVSFDNAISCSAASSTNYNSVIWDFGDGSTSTAIYCIHMYGEPGTYTVTLTAVNDYASDTTSQEIAVHTVGSNVDDTTTGSELSLFGIVWYVWTIIAAIVAVIVLAKMGVMPL